MRRASCTLEAMRELSRLFAVGGSVAIATFFLTTPAAANTCIETPASITKCWDNKGGSSITFQTSPGVQSTWGMTATGKSYKDRIIQTTPSGYNSNGAIPMPMPMPMPMPLSLLD